MFNFINSFGQRRFAKWITIFSFLGGIVGFYLEYGIDYFKTILPYFGLFLLTAPHYFLYLAAEKSKEFRLPAVFASILIVIVNFTLFAIDVSGFLFFVTISENFITFVFYLAMAVQKAATDKNKNTKR